MHQTIGLLADTILLVLQAKATKEAQEARRLQLRSLQYLERYIYLILFNAYLRLEKASSWQRPFSTWMWEVREDAEADGPAWGWWVRRAVSLPWALSTLCKDPGDKFPLKRGGSYSPGRLCPTQLLCPLPGVSPCRQPVSVTAESMNGWRRERWG